MGSRQPYWECVWVGGYELMTEFVFGLPPGTERQQMFVLTGT